MDWLFPHTQQYIPDVRAFTLVPATHTHSPVVTCCPVMFADTPARKSIKMQSAVSIFFTVPQNNVLNLVYVHLIYIGLCDYLSWTRIELPHVCTDQNQLSRTLRSPYVNMVAQPSQSEYRSNYTLTRVMHFFLLATFIPAWSSRTHLIHMYAKHLHVILLP